MKSVTQNDMSSQKDSEQVSHGEVDTCFARELEFSMLTYSAAKGQGVVIKLLGYGGRWKNSMYDTGETTEVRVLVDCLTWNKDEKSYTFEGNRVKGKRIGDATIAAESQPERYRITVSESLNPTSSFETLHAVWSLIPIART